MKRVKTLLSSIAILGACYAGMVADSSIPAALTATGVTVTAAALIALIEWVSDCQPER